jgi:uncharacterized membrane protein
MSLLSQRVLDATTVAGALGAGVVGGVLFGFSTFVMSALDRLPADRAIEAMQSINRQAPTAGFLSAMLGTAAVAAVLGIDGIRRLDERNGLLLTLGAGAYLASFAVTAAFHVPRNNRLAAVAVPAADAARVWRDYAGPWVAGNHVRTLLAVAAAALFTVALGSPSAC